ncbi:MAG: site-2 protease family protein [Gemmataceae bacterium]
MDVGVIAYALAGLATIVFATAIYVIGQAAVAIHYKVKVKEISLGTGPLLWQTRLRSIPFSFRPLPGGYTSYFDEDDELEVQCSEPEPEFDPDRVRFKDMNPLGKLFLLLIGPISSLVLGVLLLGAPIWAGAPGLVAVGPAESTIQPCSVGGLIVLADPVDWQTQEQLFVDTAGELGVRVLLFRSTEDWGGPLSLLLTSGFVAHQTPWGWCTLLGVMLVGIGFLNLLPVPTLNGFYMLCLLYDVLAGKPLSENAIAAAMWIGLLFMVVIWIRLLYIDLRWIWNFVL